MKVYSIQFIGTVMSFLLIINSGCKGDSVPIHEDSLEIGQDSIFRETSLNYETVLSRKLVDPIAVDSMADASYLAWWCGVMDLENSVRNAKEVRTYMRADWITEGESITQNGETLYLESEVKYNNEGKISSYYSPFSYEDDVKFYYENGNLVFAAAGTRYPDQEHTYFRFNYDVYGNLMSMYIYKKNGLIYELYEYKEYNYQWNQNETKVVTEGFYQLYIGDVNHYSDIAYYSPEGVLKRTGAGIDLISEYSFVFIDSVLCLKEISESSKRYPKQIINHVRAYDPEGRIIEVTNLTKTSRYIKNSWISYTYIDSTQIIKTDIKSSAPSSAKSNIANDSGLVSTTIFDLNPQGDIVKMKYVGANEPEDVRIKKTDYKYNNRGDWVSRNITMSFPNSPDEWEEDNQGSLHVRTIKYLHGESKIVDPPDVDQVADSLLHVTLHEIQFKDY